MGSTEGRMKARVGLFLGFLAVVAASGLAFWSLREFSLLSKGFHLLERSIPTSQRPAWNKIFDPIAGSCSLVKPRVFALAFNSFIRIDPSRRAYSIVCRNSSGSEFRVESQDVFTISLLRYPGAPLTIKVIEGRITITARKLLDVRLATAQGEIYLKGDGPSFNIDIQKQVQLNDVPIYHLSLYDGHLNIVSPPDLRNRLQVNPPIFYFRGSKGGKFLLNDSPISIEEKDFYLLPSGAKET